MPSYRHKSFKVNIRLMQLLDSQHAKEYKEQHMLLT